VSESSTSLAGESYSDTTDAVTELPRRGHAANGCICKRPAGTGRSGVKSLLTVGDSVTVNTKIVGALMLSVPWLALAPAQRAHADAIDDTFWLAVKQKGMVPQMFDEESQAVNSGHMVCADFRSGSPTFDDEGLRIAGMYGVGVEQGKEFVGLAIGSYCPEQIHPAPGPNACGCDRRQGRL